MPDKDIDTVQLQLHSTHFLMNLHQSCGVLKTNIQLTLSKFIILDNDYNNNNDNNNNNNNDNNNEIFDNNNYNNHDYNNNDSKNYNDNINKSK